MVSRTETKTATLLLGNEAIALGALHAGVQVVTGYPGTPSTETLEYVARIAPPSVAVQWAINEKVALDEAVGAALAGARALVTMKHVGLNVAMDAWMTSPQVGVNGGLVLLVADDPGMHSSQNEQDSRYLGRFAGVPVFEPADSQECYDFVRLAFEVSEQWDTPVMVRTTTRVSHTRARVVPGEPQAPNTRPVLKNPRKHVMLPVNARAARQRVLQRLSEMAKWVETLAVNREELRSTAVGIVTAGPAYHYVRDVMPSASTLKLGITHPLPEATLRRFAQKVGRLLVVEELEPYLEENIRSLGLAVEGKAFFPRFGELSSALVRKGLEAAEVLTPSDPGGADVRVETVTRPPVLCPGCPHATPFWALRALDAYVHGDIGCYTLGASEPLQAMDTCLSMGSSIGMAVGMAKAGFHERPIVAVIGDSTFFHAGIPALIDAVWNGVDITVVILDNGTTAMTGGQPHPGTGANARGGGVPRVDLVELCRAIGVQSVAVVDPYDLGATRRALLAATRHRGVSVVVTNRPCVQAPVKVVGRPYTVDDKRCDGCLLCLNLGCPALSWFVDAQGVRRVRIDGTQCVGCTVCAQLCPQGAIEPTSSGSDPGRGEAPLP